MKKLLAILLTMAMLVTTLAFPLPVSAKVTEGYGNALVVDGVIYRPSAISTSSYWDASTRTLVTTADGVWSATKLVATENLPTGVTKVTINATSTVGGQNVHIIYSDGTQSGGWINFQNGKTIEFATDPTKTIAGFSICPNGNSGAQTFTINDITFTYETATECATVNGVSYTSLSSAISAAATEGVPVVLTAKAQTGEEIHITSPVTLQGDVKVPGIVYVQSELTLLGAMTFDKIVICEGGSINAEGFTGSGRIYLDESITLGENERVVAGIGAGVTGFVTDEALYHLSTANNTLGFVKFEGFDTRTYNGITFTPPSTGYNDSGSDANGNNHIWIDKTNVYSVDVVFTTLPSSDVRLAVKGSNWGVIPNTSHYMNDAIPVKQPEFTVSFEKPTHVTAISIITYGHTNQVVLGSATVNMVKTYAEKTYVAQVGMKQYTTLDAALAAANNGDTIKLLTDCTLNGYVLSKAITLDLNGVNLTPAASFTFDVGGHLTLIGQPFEGLVSGSYTTSADTNGNIVFTFNPVASQAAIGETEYATLEEAYEAAVEGDTITLLLSSTLENDLVIDKAITIAGQGTITGNVIANVALGLSGNVHIPALTLGENGAINATEYTGTVNVTLDPALAGDTHKTVATGMTSGTITSTQEYKVSNYQGTVNFVYDRSIYTTDGTTLKFAWMSDDTTWDHVNKVWSTPSAWKQIEFVPETNIIGAYILRLTLKNDFDITQSKSQEIHISYEGEANATVYSLSIDKNIDTKTFAITLDPEKAINRIMLKAGTASNYTFEEVTFLRLEEGKTILTEDITANITFDQSASGSHTYDPATRTITYAGAWSNAWINLNEDYSREVVAVIIDYTVESGTFYTSIKDKNGSQPSVISSTVAASTTKQHSLPYPANGLKSVGWSTNTAGSEITINSVKVQYIADAPVEAPAPELTGAQLALGADLAVGVIVPAASFVEGGYTDAVLHATIGKYAQDVSVKEYDEETDSYVFWVDHITPAMMSETMSAYLTAIAPDGTEFTGETQSATIKDLCEYYAQNEDTEFISEAILEYGAASEMYVGAEKTTTADVSKIKDVLGDLTTLYGKTVKGVLGQDTINNSLATWKAANLFLTDSIAIKFKFTTTENIEGWNAVVNGKSATITDLGNNTYSVYFDAWSAADFSSPVAVALYNAEDTQVSHTLNYSILDYALYAEGTNNTELKNLTRSILKYVAGVDNYTSRTEWDIPSMKDVYDYFFGNLVLPELATDTIHLTADNAKHLGRTYITNDATWLGYSGAGAEFTYEGSILEVEIAGDYKLAKGEVTEETEEAPRYAIYLDGEKVVDAVLTSETSSNVHTLLAGTTVKTHTVRIVKLTTGFSHNVAIKGITINKGKTISATPAKDINIEFIGDSITCGLYTDTESTANQNSNATLSYAHIASEMLNADYSIVALGGASIFAKEDILISDLYGSTIAKFGPIGGVETPIAYDFSKKQNDFVVINLGTNDRSAIYGDWNQPEYNEANDIAFVAAYVEFLKTVRANNPDAHIVCTVGPMTTQVQQDIQDAIYNYKQETDDHNISLHEMAAPNPTNDLDPTGHPTAATHELLAEELYEHITAIRAGAHPGDVDVTESILPYFVLHSTQADNEGNPAPEYDQVTDTFDFGGNWGRVRLQVMRSADIRLVQPEGNLSAITVEFRNPVDGNVYISFFTNDSNDDKHDPADEHKIPMTSSLFAQGKTKVTFLVDSTEFAPANLDELKEMVISAGCTEVVDITSIMLHFGEYTPEEDEEEDDDTVEVDLTASVLPYFVFNHGYNGATYADGVVTIPTAYAEVRLDVVEGAVLPMNNLKSITVEIVQSVSANSWFTFYNASCPNQHNAPAAENKIAQTANKLSSGETIVTFEINAEYIPADGEAIKGLVISSGYVGDITIKSIILNYDEGSEEPEEPENPEEPEQPEEPETPAIEIDFTKSVHTYLTKFDGGDDVTYDAATGTVTIGAGSAYNDYQSLRLNPIAGATFPLEGLKSITIELDAKYWSTINFGFFAENNSYDSKNDPEKIVAVDVNKIAAQSTSVICIITDIPEGATELKQIAIKTGLSDTSGNKIDFTFVIKSIILNYE